MSSSHAPPINDRLFLSHFQDSSVLVFLDVEVYSNMPRSKAAPEGNGPVHQQEEFGPDQPTLADVYRLLEERFDRQLQVLKSVSPRGLRFIHSDSKIASSNPRKALLSQRVLFF